MRSNLEKNRTFAHEMCETQRRLGNLNMFHCSRLARALSPCFARDTNLFIAQFSGRITTSKRIKGKTKCTLKLRSKRSLHHSTFGACGEPDRKYGGSALSLCPYC